ncbi:MAG: hypothetical protein Q8O14_10910 [bacterium]|jgi:hypothetical protein|nr:hypothetical protein [bacterium]
MSILLSPGRLALLLLLLAAIGAAVPPLPDHRPVGSPRPLEAGDHFTLLATRLFLSPSLADSFVMVGQDLPATLLDARGNFYQLRLEERVAGLPGPSAWVYRSELELRDLAGLPSAAAPRPKILATPLAARPLAKGDTLTLQAPLLFQGPDLLGEHELYPGRQLLTVLAAENSQGFVQVRTADGRGGWLHRAELAEERRRPR